MSRIRSQATTIDWAGALARAAERLESCRVCSARVFIWLVPPTLPRMSIPF